jgi:glycosyltransferase involved in cell wall biosynthesis
MGSIGVGEGPAPVPRRDGGDGHRLVCLLPARNCAGDLPDYLDSVSRFADAIVALDDGSTDETRSVLAAHPIVRIILSNPRRDGHSGWDDSANRNRLLAAAAELNPVWIVSLDADERIDPDDAAALRKFIESEEPARCGYLLRVLRMIGDLENYDQSDLWVGRLFPYEPGQRFPTERLHFVALPTSIPRDQWVRTTIRIQHLAGMTEERRQARFKKYLEADPTRAYQRTYDHLLARPGRLHRWEPRPPSLPVVANAAWPWEPQDRGGTEPVLSAIVISRNDESRIERAVRSVLEQDCSVPFEVIAVTSGTDGTAHVVRDRFPGVTVVELPHPALPGEARNAGLRVARGRYVTFPGSHSELVAGNLDARIGAHQLGFAMVTPTTLNGTRTLSGWASYFLSHSSLLPESPSGRLSSVRYQCSYLKEALLHVGGFPEGMRAGEDTVVNEKLFRLGYGVYRAPDAVVLHHSSCRNPVRLLRHHFVRGRAMGQIIWWERSTRPPPGRNRRLLRFVLVSVPGRLRWTTVKVHRWGKGLRVRYWLAFPLVAAGAAAYWLGACFELGLGRKGSRPSPIEVWAARAALSSSDAIPAAAAARKAMTNGRLRVTRHRSSPGA